MDPLAISDLYRNAFRILGLTSSAGQGDIDAAARRMRLWSDPASIPASPNDAPWIGPIPRSPSEIEGAVARLADPLMRLHERLWWFCQTPPVADDPQPADPSNIAAYHDAAILRLYRSLMIDAAGDNLTTWQETVECFRTLATSDDCLQWLFEVESAGDFEKRATLDEIGQAQLQIPARLSSAIVKSVDEAVARGDFVSVAQAAQLARGSVPAGGDRPPVSSRADGTGGMDEDPALKLIDQMEDELAGRCNELKGRIDKAWKTRKVALLRPACNHAISRYNSVIRPLIEQLISATDDPDRQERARMPGIDLLIHASEAHEACKDFMASQRVLSAAQLLAAGTAMQPRVNALLEKVAKPAKRQRRGAAWGFRESDSNFKVKPGVTINGES